MRHGRLDKRIGVLETPEVTRYDRQLEEGAQELSHLALVGGLLVLPAVRLSRERSTRDIAPVDARTPRQHGLKVGVRQVHRERG